MTSQGIPTSYDKRQQYLKEKGDSFGVNATWFIVHSSREQLIRIGELIDSGQLRPVVDTILLKQIKPMKVEKIFISMVK